MSNEYLIRGKSKFKANDILGALEEFYKASLIDPNSINKDNVVYAFLKRIHNGADELSEDNLPKRKPWRGTLTEASYRIREKYNRDVKSKTPKYRSLKDATKMFFASYEFVNYPQITVEKLYENVKQAR